MPLACLPIPIRNIYIIQKEPVNYNDTCTRQHFDNLSFIMIPAQDNTLITCHLTVINPLSNSPTGLEEVAFWKKMGKEENVGN